MKYFAIATFGLIAAQSGADLLHAETTRTSGSTGQKEFAEVLTPSGASVTEQEGSTTKFLQTTPIVSAAGLYDESSSSTGEDGEKILGDVQDPVYSEESNKEKADGAGTLMASVLSVGVALVSMA